MLGTLNPLNRPALHPLPPCLVHVPVPVPFDAALDRLVSTFHVHHQFDDPSASLATWGPDHNRTETVLFFFFLVLVATLLTLVL